MRGDWKGSLSIEQRSLTADSEGKELLWQVLPAVRAVDELGAWITSCQMLKSCQLKVCEEEGGQLLNPRQKRGGLKSNYRWRHVDEGEPSMCSVDPTQMDAQHVTRKKSLLLLKSGTRPKRGRQSEKIIIFKTQWEPLPAHPLPGGSVTKHPSRAKTKSWTESLWWAARLQNGTWKTKRLVKKVTVFGNMYHSEETLTLDKTWERWCPSCPVSVLISNWGIVHYLTGSFFHLQPKPAETLYVNCKLYQSLKQKKGLKTACNLLLHQVLIKCCWWKEQLRHLTPN